MVRIVRLAGGVDGARIVPVANICHFAGAGSMKTAMRPASGIRKAASPALSAMILNCGERPIPTAAFCVQPRIMSPLMSDSTRMLAPVALYKKPMVIAYKMMAASWQVMRHMGYQPWVGLPNILAREFLVPELLQHAATPEAIADALWKQLTDGNARQALAQRFTDMHHALLRDTARLSADAVLEMISNHRGRP